MALRQVLKKGRRGNIIGPPSRVIVTEKSWKKLKGRIKEITRKTAPLRFDERIRQLLSNSHYGKLGPSDIVYSP